MPFSHSCFTGFSAIKVMLMKMLLLRCGKIEAFLRSFAICSRYFFRFVWYLVFLG
jgi:hypothetical protein